MLARVAEHSGAVTWFRICRIARGMRAEALYCVCVCVCVRVCKREGEREITSARAPESDSWVKQNTRDSFIHLGAHLFVWFSVPC